MGTVMLFQGGGGIRDFSKLPDNQVPTWVRERREWARRRRREELEKMCSCNLHWASRAQVLGHCDKTGHKPLVETDEDYCIVREDFYGPDCDI